MIELTKTEIRRLRGEAQRLKAVLKLGKHGLSAEFVKALDEALTHHGLVKVKFDEFKEQRHELAPQLAEKSGSRLITMVGHVVVLFRPKPEKPGEAPKS
jgi:RNA-binding protein